jgi:hypothetical protein
MHITVSKVHFETVFETVFAAPCEIAESSTSEHARFCCSMKEVE